MGCAPMKPVGFDKDLARHDKRLRVRWDPRRNLWLVEEFLHSLYSWSYVMYWADCDPRTLRLTYRPLPQTAEGLFREVVKGDLDRLVGPLNDNPSRWSKHADMLDADRQKKIREHARRWDDVERQYAIEMASRGMRGRRSFGRNGAINTGRPSFDPVLRDWVRSEVAARRAEQPGRSR